MLEASNSLLQRTSVEIAIEGNQARGSTSQMRTLPSRDDSLLRMMPYPGALGRYATWLSRAVERGWHLLTGKLRTKLLVAFLGVALCPLLVLSYRDSEVTRS